MLQKDKSNDDAKYIYIYFEYHQKDQILKVYTHHKIVVLGGLGHEFWSALSNPDTDLHVPSILALLCFTHLTHNPGNTNWQNCGICTKKKHMEMHMHRQKCLYENPAGVRLASKRRADFVIQMDLNLRQNLNKIMYYLAATSPPARCQLVGE